MKLVSSLCQISGQSDECAGSSEDEAPPEKTPRYDPKSRLRGRFKAHHELIPCYRKAKIPPEKMQGLHEKQSSKRNQSILQRMQHTTLQNALLW